jgi:hypothetical protein
MTDTTPSAAQIASRIGAALLGGYGFVWGFVSLGIVLGVAAGLPYEEAQTLLFLLAFLLLLAAFCWAFVARSIARVWAVLAGGGAAMTGAAWLVQRNLL